MRKLRLIFLLILVSICPVLWAGSHVWLVIFGRHGGSHEYYVEIAGGSIVAQVQDDHETPQWDVYYWQYNPHDCDWWGNYSFAGFAATMHGDDAHFMPFRWSFFRLPFWFLSCVGFLMGWWLWRRGKRKREKMAKGFPVEAKQVE